MKINEILTESGDGSMSDDVRLALPGTVEFAKLKNQDPYKQLRMGVAMAAARSDLPMDTESSFGEDMTIIGYTDEDIETIQLAMKLLGQEYTGPMKRMNDQKSEETPDVNSASPVAKPTRNRYGV